MFPVPETGFSATGRVHEVRSDCGRAPVTARHSLHLHPRSIAWAIPLAALVLCLALPGLSWAAMPIEESPVGSSNSPRAIQEVTWSNFAPADWVITLPVECSITASSADGLVGVGDGYSWSTDGGLNWSGWLAEGLNSFVLDANTRRITVTGLPFGDSATQNLIRFRTYETGDIEAISPDHVVKVDVTEPGAPQGLVATPSGWTGAANFSVQWTNPPDLTAIARAWYRLDSAPISPTDGISVITTTSISGIAPAADGVIPVYVWLEDAHGRIGYSNAVSTTLYLDTTLPKSSAAITTQPAASGWYTTSVNIQFTAADQPEDPLYPPFVYTSLDGGVWTPWAQLDVADEGSHILRYQARDKVNNIEPAKTITLSIDMTPPTFFLAAGRLPNASGWYTASVPYTLTVSDSVSDQPKSYYRLDDGEWQTGTGFTLAADGIYRVEAYGEDLAGNRSATVTEEVRLDAAAPVTDWAKEGAPGDNGWYVSDVTVLLLPTENVSGVASTRYRINETEWKTGWQFLIADDGIYNVSYASVDNAGNAELPITRSLKIDTVAPAAPMVMQVVPSAWTNVNAFDVTWTNPGDLSGVAGAYYKLGEAPTGPRDGIPITGTNRIDDLAAPADGVHRLYLWLRDGAGNTDHTTAPVQGPFLRYDGTPPATTIDVDGNLGSNGWYRSPVNATLAATDGTSGVSALRYRVGGGEWKLAPSGSVSLSYAEAGVYNLEYYAEDVAGNKEAVKTRAVKVDYTAPVPSQVSVLPEKGSATNSFRLEWPTIEDLSGVTGAYVKFGGPPSGPADGVFYAGADAVDGVVTPGEGRHTAYVWLADAAGNVDHTTAVVLPDAVCYDVTPPVTVVTHTLPSGLDGWHLEPVTFAMSAFDAGSGVREIRHRVGEGSWTSADPFVFGEDGRHTIRISAIDHAGNTEDEDAHVYQVAIDRTPPQAAFTAAASIESEPGFEVAWSGWDRANGSGLASFDVDVRDGYDAPWEPWLQETSLTTAHFDGERGHTHFFRVFARDRAGNRQPVGGITRVLIQPVLSGGFDNGVFPPFWDEDGMLFTAVGFVIGPDGKIISAAQLGSEDYGPCYLEDTDQRLPQDRATISQTITIPPPSQVQWPVLTFWYRVKTYDVMYSQARQRRGDTFDVKLCAVDTSCTGPYDGAEVELLLQDGNPMDSTVWWNLYEGAPPLYDSGWKFAMIDLSRWAGQTLQLVFANENRIDNMFNTWSYVADVRIVDLFQRTLAPFVSVPGVRAAAAAVEPSRGAEILTPASEESIR